LSFFPYLSLSSHFCGSLIVTVLLSNLLAWVHLVLFGMFYGSILLIFCSFILLFLCCFSMLLFHCFTLCHFYCNYVVLPKIFNRDRMLQLRRFLNLSVIPYLPSGPTVNSNC
jgi:hypothetical protein